MKLNKRHQNLRTMGGDACLQPPGARDRDGVNFRPELDTTHHTNASFRPDCGDAFLHGTYSINGHGKRRDSRSHVGYA